MKNTNSPILTNAATLQLKRLYHQEFQRAMQLEQSLFQVVVLLELLLIQPVLIRPVVIQPVVIQPALIQLVLIQQLLTQPHQELIYLAVVKLYHRVAFCLLHHTLLVPTDLEHIQSPAMDLLAVAIYWPAVVCLHPVDCMEPMDYILPTVCMVLMDYTKTTVTIQPHQD